MAWSARLIKPVVPPDGAPIVTLSDARAYLLALPKSRHHEPVVATAIEAVLMVAEGRGPMLLAQSAMAHVVHGPPQPLNRGKPDRPWLRRSRHQQADHG